jgi:transposase
VNDGTGLAEALLGLPGFRVLAVAETSDEVVIRVETTATFVGCDDCGTRAQAHDRVEVAVRDLACFGRPARLVWRKRRWRCRESLCERRTWTETSPHLDAQVVLTRRAGAEACRQVGELARPVATVAEEFGVCWWTVMNAVVEHGTPLVDDPRRVGRVRQLGIDETSFLKANRRHATVYATGIVDLRRHVVIDMIAGNKAADCADGPRTPTLGGWEASGSWRPIWPRASGPGCRRIWITPAGSRIPSMSCASRTAAWTRSAAACRTTRSATAAANTIRCFGSASCCSPATSASTITAATGCCSACATATRDEVLGAWLAKESVRDVYLADSWREARVLLDMTIKGCLADDLPEIVALGNTLRSWRPEILAHHATGPSNGPTEGLNLCVKKVKRCGHGFRTFEHYRLRVLLHTGGVTWPARPQPPRIRTRAPHSIA